LVISSQTVTPSDVWLVEDCDNDGITNGEELENGNNPFDPCDPNPTLPSCITDIFIPQAFTPNSDGDNDYFEIVGLENYPINHLTIFNRWGNIVFETDNYTNDWQGTTNVNLTLGGELLPTGTYFYILDLKQEDMEIFKGYVYIQR
jgi:gliding motility-associated-like protein